mmetsp:Transcript_41582/g.50440  ORF Transcript_41582/g.50440 Transcript_41582/m.50440 type:complete len:166 (+) Transcript_41582:154-651(+)|eukprot:CAMPEP_0197846770 /NCGR_PEP_ID=MMETSP1438-20131217/4343_1 /TAXON_ID=1461541 /ORGANISM="Pterosperma sp., Strain CCMP1384" /LENGTH=165 /DNA_ID=CAMNT_0043458533 /DNA_START=154 /DNA_END=651 /DNA_ORIENTATION=+
MGPDSSSKGAFDGTFKSSTKLKSRLNIDNNLSMFGRMHMSSRRSAPQYTFDHNVTTDYAPKLPPVEDYSKIKLTNKAQALPHAHKFTGKLAPGAPGATLPIGTGKRIWTRQTKSWTGKSTSGLYRSYTGHGFGSGTRFVGPGCHFGVSAMATEVQTPGPGTHYHQ